METYKTDVICNYLNTTDYQEQLLCALNLQESESESITQKVSDIYKCLKDDNKLLEVYKPIKEKVIFLYNAENDVCFIFLFGYETFYIIHKLICHYKLNNEILEDYIKELVDKINEI
jgi:hypothetical protein